MLSPGGRFQVSGKDNMGRIKRIIGAFLHAPERFDELAERIAQTGQRVDEAGREANKKEDAIYRRIDGMDIHWFTDRLCENHELLAKLNRELSINPTIWGKSERLEIDETAAVFTCFFNTNSGRIRVGKYTFAGSGVSLLAGSHDPQLTGFLRRDAELTEGCDIIIGNGVWLASNSTVLGPCTIGDNAVIAAGAVLVPGTEVPAGAIYGGVPAREIGRVQTVNESETNSLAIRKAIERNDGVLFVRGWSSRINEAFLHPAHWLFGEGTVLTSLKKAELQYHLEDAERAEILITGPGGEERIVLEKPEGVTEIILPVLKEEISKVCFKLVSTDVRVLMAVFPGEDKN